MAYLLATRVERFAIQSYGVPTLRKYPRAIPEQAICSPKIIEGDLWGDLLPQGL